ncbi:N-acetyltransferase 9-like protein like [Argiope bruennichi]|uniref:N-acetyltransferase 9-like protein like n=1 Tax=Argiope bruennichi TaxID=94029 RepID=A0A8T0EJI3_ARGBR|nr:N-acetyltransferase 9-like protein like [Argiope bruennichi]
MQSPELLELTASEPLTLEQEYEMQQSWFEDEDRLEVLSITKFIAKIKMKNDASLKLFSSIGFVEVNKSEVFQEIEMVCQCSEKWREELVSNTEIHHLNAHNRGRLKAGQSVTNVAAAMDVSNSVISRLKKTAEGGNALQKYVGGCGRNTTPLEDRYVKERKKEQKFNSFPDSCKPCNRYWYACFCKNNLTSHILFTPV